MSDYKDFEEVASQDKRLQSGDVDYLIKCLGAYMMLMDVNEYEMFLQLPLEAQRLMCDISIEAIQFVDYVDENFQQEASDKLTFIVNFVVKENGHYHNKHLASVTVSDILSEAYFLTDPVLNVKIKNKNNYGNDKQTQKAPI